MRSPGKHPNHVPCTSLFPFRQFQISKIRQKIRLKLINELYPTTIGTSLEDKMKEHVNKKINNITRRMEPQKDSAVKYAFDNSNQFLRKTLVKAPLHSNDACSRSKPYQERRNMD